MTANDNTTKPFESPIAFTGPCNRCGQPVDVSQFALETAKNANRILSSRGEKLLKQRDITMCPGCYEIHYSELWSKERRISSNYEYLWQQFKKHWHKASVEDREALEFDFLKSVGDYRGSYQALLKGWVGQMNSRTGGRSKASNSKEAGF